MKILVEKILKTDPSCTIMTSRKGNRFVLDTNSIYEKWTNEQFADSFDYHYHPWKNGKQWNLTIVFLFNPGDQMRGGTGLKKVITTEWL